MTISCSVSSCLCHGTCLPGAYWTRQSRACSPPIACRRTPSTNSHEARPFHVRNGRDSPGSGFDTEESFTAVRRDGLDGDVLVEDDPLSVTARLSLLRQLFEHPVGRGRHLGYPDAHCIED